MKRRANAIKADLTLKWEMFHSCLRSQIVLPRYGSGQKMVGAKEAANSDRAGQAARHGWSLIAEWAEVSRGECLAWVRVPTLTSSPPVIHTEKAFQSMRTSEACPWRVRITVMTEEGRR